jgi:hypothetical protein
MSDRDLEVNRLRTKRSSRLVLEEHGHCEVPAGCGGVVLRWRSAALVPLEIWIFATCTVEAMIDGVALATSRPLLAPGPHVFACRLSGIAAPDSVLMVAGFHEAVSQDGSGKPTKTFPLLSRDDGTWRYARSEPSDAAWSKPGFDAATWPALGARPPGNHPPGTLGSLLTGPASWFRRLSSRAPPKREDSGAAYRRGRVAEFGGEPLAIAGVGGTMVIRKDFVAGET